MAKTKNVIPTVEELEALAAAEEAQKAGEPAEPAEQQQTGVANDDAQEGGPTSVTEPLPEPPPDVRHRYRVAKFGYIYTAGSSLTVDAGMVLHLTEREAQEYLGQGVQLAPLDGFRAKAMEILAACPEVDRPELGELYEHALKVLDEVRQAHG